MRITLTIAASLMSLACGNLDQGTSEGASNEQSGSLGQVEDMPYLANAGEAEEPPADDPIPTVESSKSRTEETVLNTANLTYDFGDFNSDGLKNEADFVLFKAAFGASAGGAAYHVKFDADTDGIIGLSDFNAFRKVYGSSEKFGDFNNDGGIDQLDMTLFKAAYGARVGDVEYHPKFDHDSDGLIGLKDFNQFRLVFPAPSRFGDFNSDDKIDQLDMTLFRSAYGSSVGDAKYHPKYDFDADGLIGLKDFNQFRAVFGK